MLLGGAHTLRTTGLGNTPQAEPSKEDIIKCIHLVINIHLANISRRPTTYDSKVYILLFSMFISPLKREVWNWDLFFETKADDS